MSNYLHVIKTKSYYNDSRLIKWVESLKENGYDSEVFILEDDNIAKNSKDNDVNIIKTSLFSRRFFKKGRGFIFKIPEYSWQSIKYINKSEAKNVVFHDMQHYLTLFLLCCFKKEKNFIWDIHELPHQVLEKTFFTRWVVRFILNHVDLIIYTNAERRDYILNKYGNKETDFAILNNYVNDDYFKVAKALTPPDLKKWLQGDPYLLWLGNGSEHRNFIQLLHVFAELKWDFKLVVLGKPSQQAIDYIAAKNLKDLIYFTFVPQDEIVYYIDNALFSVVLYKGISPNNYYCEPNRLYQLTARKIPVIAGENPPMKSLITKYKVGVVLPDDGSDVKALSSAVDKMMEDRGVFIENFKEANLSSVYSWDKQFTQVIKALNKLT